MGALFQHLEPGDLIKFGLIPEFVGRLPVLATLDDLDEAALMNILTQPKNALIKQYQQLFMMENVRLTFAKEALTEVAKQAIARKTGARGLRAILENVLLDTMFEIPGLEGIEEVVVNQATIVSGAEPLRIYTEAASASAFGTGTSGNGKPSKSKQQAS